MATATHRAAGLLLAQRVFVSDAPQDHINHRIRRVDITTGATTTLAGSGVSGFNDDDVGTNAQFNHPGGVTIAPDGAFALVAVRAWPPAHLALRPSTPQRRTRLVHTPHRPAPPPSEVVATAPHTTATGSFLAQLALNASQDQNNYRIRRVDITTGATITLAGSGAWGFKDDDVGTNAQFKNPFGVAIVSNGAFALVGVRAWPPAPVAS